jgi:integrase
MYPFSHALHGDVFMSPDRGERPRWKGWQAYRRGLATNLKRLGVPDTVIQAILRHEDVSTTQRFYIKTVREDVTSAMKQLEAQIACTAVVQQKPPSNLVN